MILRDTPPIRCANPRTIRYSSSAVRRAIIYSVTKPIRHRFPFGSEHDAARFCFLAGRGCRVIG